MLETRPLGALCILLAAAAPWGCGSRDQADDPALQAAETPVEAFFRFGPVALGATRAELRASLGEPDSVTARALANRHDPSLTDSVLTLHYPGLRAAFYLAGYDGKELVAEVVIADDRYLRPDSPLRIGMPAEDVRLLLGEPTSNAAGVLGYACGSCDAAGYDRLELRLEDEGLRQITLAYWID